MVIWTDHAAVCADRRGDEDPVVGKNTHWRIEVAEHKTGNLDPVELVWSDVFMRLVKAWISRRGLKQSDAPFEKSAQWPKLKTLLWKILEDKQLLERTRGRLMANDFRRYAVKQIFDSGKDLGESDFQFKTSLHYMD